jgi:hypothetical protein
MTSRWSSRHLNIPSNAILTKLVIVNERCETQNDEFYLLVRLDRLKGTAGVLVFWEVSLKKMSVSYNSPNLYINRICIYTYTNVTQTNKKALY